MRLGVSVVRMHLHAQCLPGVQELEQQRKLARFLRAGQLRAIACDQFRQRRALRVGSVQARNHAHFQAFAGARIGRGLAVAGFQLIAPPRGGRAIAEGGV